MYSYFCQNIVNDLMYFNGLRDGVGAAEGKDMVQGDSGPGNCPT